MPHKEFTAKEVAKIVRKLRVYVRTSQNFEGNKITTNYHILHEEGYDLRDVFPKAVREAIIEDYKKKFER